jgi:hypothetical protein
MAAIRKRAKGAGEATDAEILSQLPVANARGAAARGLCATSARYNAKAQRVELVLASGYGLNIPISELPEVAEATPGKLREVQLLGAGDVLHWEALDADYSVPALVFEAIGSRLLARELARAGGRATSETKAAAARVNGAKGGRPRKRSTQRAS